MSVTSSSHFSYLIICNVLGSMPFIRAWCHRLCFQFSGDFASPEPTFLFQDGFAYFFSLLNFLHSLAIIVPSCALQMTEVWRTSDTFHSLWSDSGRLRENSALSQPVQSHQSHERPCVNQATKKYGSTPYAAVCACVLGLCVCCACMYVLCVAPHLVFL